MVSMPLRRRRAINQKMSCRLFTRPQSEIADATLDVLVCRVVQVSVQDLLRQGQGSVESAANNLQILDHLLVWQLRVLQEGNNTRSTLLNALHPHSCQMDFMVPFAIYHSKNLILTYDNKQPRKKPNMCFNYQENSPMKC